MRKRPGLEGIDVNRDSEVRNWYQDTYKMYIVCEEEISRVGL